MNPFSMTRAAAAGALLCLAAQSALAQSWTAPPYDPAVGSRWRIDTTLDSEEVRAAGERRWKRGRVSADMSVDEKTAAGYRVTYVTRVFDIDSNQPSVALISKAFGGLIDVPIQARTDAAGKPLALENPDALRPVVAKVIDDAVAPMASKPKAAEAVRNVLATVLNVDGPESAKAYLDVPQSTAADLAAIRPGEVERREETAVNPIGNRPLKTTVTTRLVSFDAAAGTARYERKRAVDPAALKEMTLAIARQLGVTGDKPMPPELRKALEAIKVTLDSTVTIDMAGGMARRLEEQSITTASALGHTYRKVENKIVTVTEMK